LPVDDSFHYKIIDESNIFVAKEIARIKSSLENIDKEIHLVKKSIKESTAKA
jgi:hypothetical protein